MKLWVKALLCISLSLMCFFNFVGYAATSGHMAIDGSVTIIPPNTLHILRVDGGNYVNPETLGYADTIVTSDLTLRDNGSGVYEAFVDITVFNNTDISYFYVAKVRGTYTMPDGTVVAYSNENIELTESIQFAEEIRPGEIKTFTVRASFKEGADTSNKSLFSIIEYQFQTTKPELKDEAAVSGVLEKFPEILNTPAYYNQLIDAMNDTSWDRLVSSYIGNVVNAGDQDSVAIYELFGESMILNIDGKDTPVTIIIKRENLDGNRNTGENPGAWINGGREMTLYITANPLDKSGAYPTVYAAVYTKTSGSDTWYQLGTVFTGTAKVVSYIGISSGTGSFDTSTWKSTDGKSLKDLV